MKTPAKKRRPPGRPKGSIGVRMPCGWGCGGEFTQAEMREHWNACPKRPPRLQREYPRFQYALIGCRIETRIIRDPKDEDPEVWKETPAALK